MKALVLASILFSTTAMADALTPYIREPIWSQAMKALQVDVEKLLENSNGTYSQEVYSSSGFQTSQQQLVDELIKNHCWGECENRPNFPLKTLNRRVTTNHISEEFAIVLEKHLENVLKDQSIENASFTEYYYSDGSSADETGIILIGTVKDTQVDHVLKFAINSRL